MGRPKECVFALLVTRGLGALTIQRQCNIALLRDVRRASIQRFHLGHAQQQHSQPVFSVLHLFLGSVFHSAFGFVLGGVVSLFDFFMFVLRFFLFLYFFPYFALLYLYLIYFVFFFQMFSCFFSLLFHCYLLYWVKYTYFLRASSIIFNFLDM